jgi:hypothetical protein
VPKAITKRKSGRVCGRLQLLRGRSDDEASSSFSPEVCARAVRMVLDHRGGHTKRVLVHGAAGGGCGNINCDEVLEHVCSIGATCSTRELISSLSSGSERAGNRLSSWPLSLCA